MNTLYDVSLVIPVRNEEQYITQCVESILAQTYPKDKFEAIFADGMSEDKTCEILESYIGGDLSVKIVKNEKKIIPAGVNLGIKNASGKVIIRLDAHSQYPENYIETCLKTLEETGADNVGGIVLAKGSNFIGEAVAYMQASRFGNGGSEFRLGHKSGYAETVPFGAFPRETFEKYGLFDERLERNEDNEINYRIRKNGGKVYLNTDIQTYYYSRNSLLKLAKMAFANGKWNMISLFLCKGVMSLKYFIPFIFVVSLLVGIPVLIFGSWILKALFIAELICYFLLDIYFTAKIVGERGLRFVVNLIIFPLFHVCYGFGGFAGLIRYPVMKKNKAQE